MKKLFALSWKELLLLARDPNGLLAMFGVPAIFILIMSLALKDAYSTEHRTPLMLQVINQDGAPLSQKLEQDLLALATFAPAREDEEAQLRVLLLPGFSELLATRYDFAGDYLAGEPEPTLLRLEFAPTLLPQARIAASLSVRQVLQAAQTSYLMRTVLGVPEEKAAGLRYVSNPLKLPLEETVTGGLMPTAVQQSVPAWLIFALFFSVIPLATSFVVERMEGSLLRLRALDVSPALLLGGKLLPYYAVNLLQMAVMLALGVWLVPALGGDALQLPVQPLALWLVTTATSMAALGMALLVAVLVRTTTQATLAGGAISLVLAALGGIMVPKLVMPPLMQAAANISPMSWALEAYWDLLLRGGGLAEVLSECAALLSFGGLALAVAMMLFRRGQP